MSYLHNQPESTLSRIVKLALRTLNWKKSIENSMLKGKFKADPAPMPKSLSSRYDIEETQIGQRKTWQISSKEGSHKRVILFLHGGAYIHNITGLHWQFISKLLAKTQTKVVVPDYPLAPFANSQDVYAFIQTLYDQLLAEHRSDDIILMGDSAGGGLALGFSQQLRSENQPLPGQIILLSPWLDIALSNPEIPDLDRKEKLLGISGLRLAGKAYAGSANPEDVRVSPIYGDLNGLPDISIFIGTHDVLFPDSKKLLQKLESAHQPVNYYEYLKMIHDWVLVTQLKEAQVAINQISNLILKK